MHASRARWGTGEDASYPFQSCYVCVCSSVVLLPKSQHFVQYHYSDYRSVSSCVFMTVGGLGSSACALSAQHAVDDSLNDHMFRSFV